jgi:hypothetical protein
VDIAFSKDPQQKYIYLADGSDEKVFIVLRDTLELVSSFGDGGRWPARPKPTKASVCSAFCQRPTLNVSR